MIVGGILTVLVILPFLFFGGAFERMLSLERNLAWMQSVRGIAWLIGIVLLVADIILPVPGTVIMSSLGLVYGFLLGGGFASAGSFLSGMLAYGLCRTWGERPARFILRDKEYLGGVAFFAEKGGWLIVLTRWLPVLSEVGACLAGLAKMPLGKFVAALGISSLSLGFIFGGLGSLGMTMPSLVVGLNVVVPLVLWGIASAILRRRWGLARSS